ncbi:MAG: hypothetical protein DME60_06240 [Verrucomicrobia bacterium]|nr:MAG: hypothetical protein DME60_06240 [Verrucomicrobiota bacterium]
MAMTVRLPAKRFFAAHVKGRTATSIRRIKSGRYSRASEPKRKQNAAAKEDNPASKPQQRNQFGRTKNIPTQSRRTKAGTKKVLVPKMLAASYMCGCKDSSLQRSPAFLGT